MSNISTKIEAAKSAIAEKKSELAKLAEAAANGEDVDASTLEQLTKSIEDDQAKMASLEKAEQVLVQKSAPAFIRNKSASEYSFEKQALVAVKAKVEGMSQLAAAEALYGQDSGVYAVTKAATPEARTDVAGWAQELVRESYGTFLELLRPAALLPQLAAKGGVSLSFDRNNEVVIPFYAGSTTALAGAFIGEGKSIPVKKTSFGSKTIKSSKLGVITVATSEILRKSTPAIEPILRDAIIRDTAALLDSVAFSAAAATPLSPAGLLNGVTPITATGTNTAEVIAALKQAITAMSNQNRTSKPVAIMTPAVHLGLSMTMTATGSFVFQSELASGRLMGMDVLVSNAAPADSIMLVDAAEVYFGLGSPNFAVSDTAALQMDDAPATGPELNASLFQQDMLAIRMITNAGWADVRGGSVQIVDGLAGV
jgi:HK97 family phage major capsid protein